MSQRRNRGHLGASPPAGPRIGVRVAQEQKAELAKLLHNNQKCKRVQLAADFADFREFSLAAAPKSNQRSSPKEQSGVYDIWRKLGMEVYLENAGRLRICRGQQRRSGESVADEIATYGPLRNSFRPPQEIRTMRTYWRQRNDLVRAAGGISCGCRRS